MPRVPLFPVPNAIDTRRPMPLPLGPSLLQFAIFMIGIFGLLGVVGLDIWLNRDIGPDLGTALAVWFGLLVATSFRIGNHMLPYWLWIANRLSTLRVIGRISWGLVPGYKMRTARESMPGGPTHKGTAVISATWAHVLHENARVLEDGIIDVSGIPILPRFLRVFISLVRGQAPYRRIIDPGVAALAEIEDAAEQAQLARVRGDFWFRLNQRASAHAIITPLDPEVIAYCAGPEEDGARALAQGHLDGQQVGLIHRHNYLTVQGATKWFLNRTTAHAVATLESHGRDARVLGSDECNAILDNEWGKRRRIPIEIGHDFVRIGTRRWVSYLVTVLERNVPLGFTLPLLDGSIPHARVALYQTPVSSGGPFGALASLTRRITLWRAAVVYDPNQFQNAIADAERVQAEIREPSGRLHRWGLVVSVPESEKEAAEKVLKERYITENGWRPARLIEDGTLKANLPIGTGDYVDYASGASSTLGLATPWTGAGLWVPPAGDKPRAILLGHSLVTAEPVGIYPFDQTNQEAWNIFIWGLMGDGKTTTIEAISRRMCKPHPKHYLAELKPRGLFIDHKTSLEYRGLVEDLGGQYIVARSWNDVKNVNVEQAALGINVSRIHPRERGSFVHDLIDKLWDEVSKRPSSEPWPGVIGMDEMHMLALTEDGRWTISELGKMARDAWFTVIYGTQDMDDALRRDETSGVGTDGLIAAAVKNSPTKIALRQPVLSKRLLMDRLAMSPQEVDLLISFGDRDGSEVKSSRGKCLVWAHGRKAPTQIVPLGMERLIFAQDPQNRLAEAGIDASVYTGQKADASTGSNSDLLRGVVGGRAGYRTRRLRGSAAYRTRVRRTGR